MGSRLLVCASLCALACLLTFTEANPGLIRALSDSNLKPHPSPHGAKDDLHLAKLKKEGTGIAFDVEWKLICKAFAVPEQVELRWMHWIKGNYSEPHRAYHTMKHVEEMLKYSNRADVKKALTEAAALEQAQPHHGQVVAPEHQLNLIRLVSVFHDIVYVTTPPPAGQPKPESNEVLSAKVFRKFVEDAHIDHDAANPRLDMAEGYKMILATETHRVPADMNPSYIEACKFLLDMDLGVLARSPREYDQYAKQIRFEYRHYTREGFREGRIKVMKHLLDKNQLYETEFFRHLWEKKARANVEREMNELKAFPLVKF